jgi:putative NADPH-quinone reductase
MNGKAMLIVGSPGNFRSNSSKIGQYLLDRLAEAGWSTEKECVYLAMKDEKLMESIFERMDASDLIILSFPLYVDSLPSQMIKFMEMVDQRRHGAKGDQRLMAVCQSGFSESRHNEYALRVCSIFARDAGYRWVGGLTVGGGAAIGGRDLNECGGMMRNLRSALDMTAKAMEQKDDVPEEARELTNKGIAPPWMYNWIVNRRWKQETRRNGVDARSKPHS